MIFAGELKLKRVAEKSEIFHASTDFEPLVKLFYRATELWVKIFKKRQIFNGLIILVQKSYCSSVRPKTTLWPAKDKQE